MLLLFLAGSLTLVFFLIIIVTGRDMLSLEVVLLLFFVFVVVVGLLFLCLFCFVLFVCLFVPGRFTRFFLGRYT